MNFDIETVVSLSILISKYKLTRSGNLIFHIIVKELHANEGYLKNETITRKSGVCEKTISNAIAELIDNKLIKVNIVGGQNYIICNFLEELQEIFSDVSKKKKKSKTIIHTFFETLGSYKNKQKFAAKFLVLEDKKRGRG